MGCAILMQYPSAIVLFMLTVQVIMPDMDMSFMIFEILGLWKLSPPDFRKKLRNHKNYWKGLLHNFISLEEC